MSFSLEWLKDTKSKLQFRQDKEIRTYVLIAHDTWNDDLYSSPPWQDVPHAEDVCLSVCVPVCLIQ